MTTNGFIPVSLVPGSFFWLIRLLPRQVVVAVAATFALSWFPISTIGLPAILSSEKERGVRKPFVRVRKNIKKRAEALLSCNIP